MQVEVGIDTLETLNKKLDKTKLYYLASPYTHKDPIVMAERFEAVNEMATRLLKLDFLLLEPIATGHIKVQYGLPTDYNYWLRRSRLFVEKSDAVIVLMIPGWDISVGVTDEIKHAKSLNKPVYYLMSS